MKLVYWNELGSKPEADEGNLYARAVGHGQCLDSVNTFVAFLKCVALWTPCAPKRSRTTSLPIDVVARMHEWTFLLLLASNTYVIE
jgi:hypothetical protein